MMTTEAAVSAGKRPGEGKENALPWHCIIPLHFAEREGKWSVGLKFHFECRKLTLFLCHSLPPSRNGSASRRTRMGPSQRDYSRSGEVPRNGNCNSVAMESSGGSTVDMKMYVALESSSSSGATSATSASSHYNNNPGYNHNNNNYHHSKGCHPETARLGMNPSGRCPYHVRLGDGEWGSADRPANNHTTAQYEVRIR